MHRGEREVNYSGKERERERGRDGGGDSPGEMEAASQKNQGPICPRPASQEWSFPRRLPASQRTRAGEWKSSASLTHLLCKEPSRGEQPLTFPGRL